MNLALRCSCPALLFLASVAHCEETPGGPISLQIDAGQVSAHVSPSLYGLMTEEINHSYDGGLYAELVQNRTFQDNAKDPVHWSLVQEGGGEGTMALDEGQPLNSVLKTSLRIDVSKLGPGQRVGIANDGFWGIPIRPSTHYKASFYAKSGADFSGPLTVSIESTDGSKTLATARVGEVGAQWKRYDVVLATADAPSSASNRLVISAAHAGTIWLNLVSLFPPTWHDRANGNRLDIMQLLSDMNPAFLRFPGGNYVEGFTIATRFDWKHTLGPLPERPGHMDDSWKYRSSDGMGLLEFLEWCEDLNMKPVLAVFAGLNLGRSSVAVAPGPDLQPFVQDALDEIEYVTGDTSTRWGAERAKDGHPDAFKLEYVEIGNEDNFDRKPGSYAGRFNQFYHAIKAVYPALQLIATVKVEGITPDVIDEHFYRKAMQFYADTARYDSYSRSGPKIFVGEWATREGAPTPNMNAALGDAAWMTGMERNSDLVVMSCYAPLFVNVNPGAMQWPTDLIGYDAMTSYGSPSYYAQKMFNLHHGNLVLGTHSTGIPTQTWQPPTPRGGGAKPPTQQVPTLFYDATRDSASGTVTIKIVNTIATAQSVHVSISGAAIGSTAHSIVLASANPTDTNTIDSPTRIVPIETQVSEVGSDFTREFPPYSITILELPATR